MKQHIRQSLLALIEARIVGGLGMPIRLVVASKAVKSSELASEVITSQPPVRLRATADFVSSAFWG
jgi:hypothetical protein